MLYGPDPQLRRETEELLGATITDALWEFACHRELVAAAKGDPRTLASFLREILVATKGINLPLKPAGEMVTRERKPAPPKAPTGRRGHGPSPRTLALSRILGRLANMEEEVVAFRRDDLGGELLQPDQVEAWLKERQAQDGEPTRWLTIPVPPPVQVRWTRGGVIIDPPLTIAESHPPVGCSVRTLAYGVPEDPWVRHLPTTEGGTLEFLRLLSESLSRKFGWWDAQATVFVLTGQIPLLHPIDAGVQHNLDVPAATRVHLTVDPTLAPREVAEAFRRVRVAVLGAQHRDLSAKHLALAEFASEHATLLATVRERGEHMAAWNRAVSEEHPDWTYREGQERQFARDCAAALRHLLEPPYRFDEWGGTP
jgi:hypothetical protein